MLPNTYFLEQYAKMRHEDMLEAVQLRQLSREIKGQKPKLWQKLTWQLGDWLIDVGYRLKREQLRIYSRDFRTKSLKV